MSWPQAEYFPFRRSFHLVNKNILYCAHTISKCANCAFKILGCQGCGIKSWSRSHDAAVFQGTSVSQHCFSLLAFVKHYAKNQVDRNISFSDIVMRQETLYVAHTKELCEICWFTTSREDQRNFTTKYLVFLSINSKTRDNSDAFGSLTSSRRRENSFCFWTKTARCQTYSMRHVNRWTCNLMAQANFDS